MEDLLNQIYQFGALPILLIVIYKLYKYNTTLQSELKEKDLEIREVEKENVKLLYKCLSAIRKITKNKEK